MAILLRDMVEDINVITESVEGGNKKNYYIEGVFIQGESPNRNNRVYPMHILEKEVGRYIREDIKEKRALGELNHPSCFHGNTKALTENGWKYINDITENEMVYSVNIETKIVELTPVIKKIKSKYSGKMISIKNRGIDTVVTPNHRFLVKNRKNEFEYITAQDILLGINSNKYNHHSILKSNDYFNDIDRQNDDNFNINNFYGELNIPILAFYRFMGIYLSEGYTQKRKNRNKGYIIYIYQNVGEKADIMDHVLNSMGISWHRYEKNGKITWSSHNIILGDYLHKFGICYDKFIDPDIIKFSSSNLARELLDMFILGDGRGKLHTKYIHCDVFSTSEKLIQNLSHLSFIAGRATKYYINKCSKDYIFADRIIEVKNKNPLHMLQLLNTKSIYIDKRFLNVVEIDYDDYVYCLETKNENFYAEDSGYSFWTGNSPNINLDKVSHLITSLQREGNDYIGKAKILDTPNGKIVESFLKEEIKIGVSTRGMGSVIEKAGIMEVQSDFRLATAGDIVANPSAQKAFVNGIMEGREWIFDLASNSWTAMELVEKTKKSGKILNENEIYQIFAKFISKIK